MAYALPTAEEDRRIVASWRDATDEGFDAFYQRYAAPLRALCTSRLKGGAEAEDACQEALLKAYAAMPRFRSEARIWPWLATIAGNVCIDIQRRRLPEPVDARGAAIDVAVEELDPSEELTGRLRTELVDDALAALPDRYRVPLYLREVEGWSYSEIAALEGTTVASVRSSLLRGRRLLRRRLVEMAESRGLWPLPAVFPVGVFRVWRQRLARFTQQPPAMMAADLAGALAASLPNVANAAIAALALVGGIGGASGAGAPATTPHEPVPVAAFADAVPYAGTPDGSAPGPSAYGGDAPPPLEVVVAPAGSGMSARGLADLADPRGRSLNARILAKVPGGEDTELAKGGLTVGCDAGITGRTACHAVDQIPDWG